MKKYLLLFCFASASFTVSFAQIPFPNYDTISANNISTRIMVHGDMFWDIPDGVADCHFPRHSPASMNFASALWMSGYDAGNNLHIASQMYRQNGNDYWPGPLIGDTITYAVSQEWANIWKVNASDITTFLGLSVHTVANTPPSILSWPGNGNIYATGNGGIPLTVSGDMAPFADLNGNGIYEPLQGEYPAIRGDQALWWVFNDHGPSHNCSGGRPLGIEVHAMAYEYNRGTALDNVLYFDYNLTNKSTNSYSNFRLAQWDDVDLGWYLDDYIGFDSTWRLGIGYNGTNDDGAGGGHPVNSYGLYPPAMGITMIVLPGDAGSTIVPAGSFTYFNNDASIIGNPTVDTQFNNYMRSKLLNGQHFTDDYAGPGILTKGYGSGPNTNYVFTGNPFDTSQWSECRSNNNPSDRRFVIATNDFTLAAGGTQHLVFALIAVDSAGGCPVFDNTSIKNLADTAWQGYHNPPPSTAVNNIAAQGTFNIYPVPAHDKLFIDVGSALSEATINVYNTLGQLMSVAYEKDSKKYTVDVSQIPPGVYNVLYKSRTLRRSMAFVKQ